MYANLTTVERFVKMMGDFLFKCACVLLCKLDLFVFFVVVVVVIIIILFNFFFSLCCSDWSLHTVVHRNSSLVYKYVYYINWSAL